ncbi:MAG: DNA polymerase III subunit delta [Anaerolineales bacterium]|nr:DNA polymerase III subunit delta [Anaerolineales bacterium]
MIHLFLNADEYLTAERLAALKAGIGDPEMAGLNTTELAAGQTSSAAILAEASMMPFLTEKRLVIVRGYLDALDKRMAASKSPGADAYVDAAYLFDHWPDVPDTAILAFVDPAVDRRRSLWKGFTLPAAGGKPERKVPGLEAQVKQGGLTLEEAKAPAQKELPEWIRERAKQHKIAIAPDAVMVLADFVGPNLRLLDNELVKLSLYALGRTITAADVRAMVSDVNEEMFWNLTDGLAQRNPKGAMRALHDLRRNEESPIGLLGAIVRQYRLLIQVKVLQQAGQHDSEAIARQLKEKEYPVKKALQLVGRYSFAELEEIMEQLLEADMAMKTGADQDTEIAVLIAELTQKK